MTERDLVFVLGLFCTIALAVTLDVERAGTPVALLLTALAARQAGWTGIALIVPITLLPQYLVFGRAQAWPGLLVEALAALALGALVVDLQRRAQQQERERRNAEVTIEETQKTVGMLRLRAGRYRSRALRVTRQRVARQAQEARLLADAPLELLNDPNYATIYDRIARVASGTLGDACRVDVWDTYGRHVERFWSAARERTSELETFLDDPRLIVQMPEIRRLMRNRRAIVVEPVSEHTWVNWTARPIAQVPARPHAVLVVPVVIAGLVRATIAVAQRTDANPYDAPRIAMAEDFAKRTAIVIVHLLRLEQVLAARYRAERGEQAKAAALAAFSHDMRTPLQAVNGYSQLLLEQIAGPLTTRQHEYLQRIQQAQERLSGFADRVLALARLDREVNVHDVRRVDVAAAVHDVVSLFAVECERKSLRLHIDDGTADLTVRADPDKVTRVLQNLISNAVKYTPPGGTVALHWQASGDTMEMRVADTGPGVPAHELESIFRPFYQLDQLADGAGLGLAISRGLARAMGGDLLVQSEVGRGSVFTLRLPLAEPARAEREPMRVQAVPIQSLIAQPVE